MAIEKRLISALLLLLLLPALPSCRAKTSEESEAALRGNGTAPIWSRDAVIYELNVRQYSPEGTLAAVERDLPRLRDMGVDILWLMPIHPIGEKNRKGSMGSYYAVRDYRAVNPEFGTEEDFRRFVKRAHELGLYVILDWVANHSAWDNPLIEEHPEWYTRDSLSGEIIPPVADWSDVADFNYDEPGLRNYMTESLEYWVREFDIDGYRCDVADWVPVSFWDSVRVELDAIKPVFMLAEAENPALHTRAFDMSYAWELHHQFNKLAQGTLGLDELDAYWVKEDSTFAPADYRMVFTSNHDENSWNGTVFERMGDAAQMMAAFSFVVPGMPLIYSGQEAPMRKRLAFFEKDPIDWNGYAWQDFYAALTRIKSDHPALWNGVHGGGMQRLATNNDSAFYALERSRDGSRVLAVFHFSDQPGEGELSQPLPDGNYRDLITNERLSAAEASSWTLPAWGYRLLAATE
jgi:cyclomaltodextrinase